MPDDPTTPAPNPETPDEPQGVLNQGQHFMSPWTFTGPSGTSHTIRLVVQNFNDDPDRTLVIRINNVEVTALPEVEIP